MILKHQLSKEIYAAMNLSLRGLGWPHSPVYTFSHCTTLWITFKLQVTGVGGQGERAQLPPPPASIQVKAPNAEPSMRQARAELPLTSSPAYTLQMPRAKCEVSVIEILISQAIRRKTVMEKQLLYPCWFSAFTKFV